MPSHTKRTDKVLVGWADVVGRSMGGEPLDAIGDKPLPPASFCLVSIFRNVFHHRNHWSQGCVYADVVGSELG